MSDVLFDGEDLLVGGNLNRHGHRLVITFDFWRPRPDHRVHGFCEGMLKGFGVDAIHLVSKDNHWFQTAELMQAAALIRPIAARYQAVFGLGSSMGGFGAMHYAAHFGATAVLALSPLYAFEPATPPFERRWAQDVRAVLGENKRLSPPSQFPQSAVVIYDPHTPDREHVQLFRSKTLLQEIRLPYSGHPSTWGLSETGLLPELLQQFLGGAVDAQALHQNWRRLRSSSKFYHEQMASRAKQRDAHRRRAKRRRPLARLLNLLRGT